MKYRHFGNPGFGLLDSALEKLHFSETLGTTDTELQKVHLPQNLTYLKIPVGLALRGRALDMRLSLNKIGHVGRGVFLVVLLYFFVWPQVTHRITMVQLNISMEGRKRGQ